MTYIDGGDIVGLLGLGERPPFVANRWFRASRRSGRSDNARDSGERQSNQRSEEHFDSKEGSKVGGGRWEVKNKMLKSGWRPQVLVGVI